MRKSFIINDNFLDSLSLGKLNYTVKTGDIENIYNIANKAGVIAAPMGLSVEVIKQDNNKKYDVYLASDIWGTLKIMCGTGIVEEYAVQENNEPGYFLIRNIVDIANNGLANLVYAADIVLAQFSDNQAMLEQLAGSGDSMVRALIKNNTDSSEAAKILATLRDKQN